MGTKADRTEIDTVFGHNLRIVRETAGMSAEEAAAGVGITVAELNHIENGLMRPAAGLVVRLSRTVRVSVVDLFFGDASLRDARSGEHAGATSSESGKN
jgi:transcriptional regulator with XRE-family HTH domain